MSKESATRNNVQTKLLYLSIGVNAGIALFLAYYWLLLQTSTMTAFYYSTQADPVYMWVYIVTTLATVILFGVNVALAVYLFRRTRRLTVKDQSGTVLGGAVGAFAAACPVCGAFLLSLIGVTGGLASLPFNGLEVKVVSLLLIIVSLWLIQRQISGCKSREDEVCPRPASAQYRREDGFVFASLVLLLIVLLWIGRGMLQAEAALSSLTLSCSVLG